MSGNSPGLPGLPYGLEARGIKSSLDGNIQKKVSGYLCKLAASLGCGQDLPPFTIYPVETRVFDQIEHNDLHIHEFGVRKKIHFFRTLLFPGKVESVIFSFAGYNFLARQPFLQRKYMKFSGGSGL